MNKIFKHKRGASGLKVVCEFAKSHCSSTEKSAINAGDYVASDLKTDKIKYFISGLKTLSIATIFAVAISSIAPVKAIALSDDYGVEDWGFTYVIEKDGGLFLYSTKNKNVKYGVGGKNKNGRGEQATMFNGYIASGRQSTVVGYGARGTHNQSTAFGSNTGSYGAQGTAIGNDAYATALGAVAIGNDDMHGNEQDTSTNGKKNLNVSRTYDNHPLTEEELKNDNLQQALYNVFCSKGGSANDKNGKCTQDTDRLKSFGLKYDETQQKYVLDDQHKTNAGQYSLLLAGGQGSISIGSRSISVGEGSTALGVLAKAYGDQSTALGTLSKAMGKNSFALGANSTATEENSMAFGVNSSATMKNSIAIGYGSKTDYTGSNAKPYMPGNGYAMPMAKSVGVVSVGSNGQPRRIVNLAAGALDTDAVNVSQLKSLAENLGVDDISNNTDKAMRYLSVNRTSGEAKTLQDKIQKEKDFKTYAQYRKYHDTMEVNIKKSGDKDLYGEEKKKLEDEIKRLEAKHNEFKDKLLEPTDLKSLTTTSSEENVKKVLAEIEKYGETNHFKVDKAELKKHNATNEGATGADALAFGYDAKAEGENAISIGKGAQATGKSSINIGGGSVDNIDKLQKDNLYRNILIGGNKIQNDTKDKSNKINTQNKMTKINQTTIIGSENKIDGTELDKSIIMGSRHEINQKQPSTSKLGQNVIIGEKQIIDDSEQATTIGNDIVASGARGGVAIGGDDASTGIYRPTKIEGKASIAMGTGAQALKEGAMSLGLNSEASGVNSTALGKASYVTTEDGVALGSKSFANTDKQKKGLDFSNGGEGASTAKTDATWQSTLAAVSIGGKEPKPQKDKMEETSKINTRQITNLAAGTQDTDAVNVAQLKSLATYVSQGFKVKGKGNGNTDIENTIKFGSTLEFASNNDYLKVTHTKEANGNSKFTFDIDKDKLKQELGNVGGGTGGATASNLKFKGDIGDFTAKNEVNIKGGATEQTKLSENNIGVVSDNTNTLNVKLAKELKNLTSAEFKNGTSGGTTIINGDGITYTPNGNTNSNEKVSLGKDGISAGGKTIQNVGDATNSTDAVNKKYVDNKIKDFDNKINSVNQTATKIGEDLKEAEKKLGGIDQKVTENTNTVEKLIKDIQQGNNVFFNAEADVNDPQTVKNATTMKFAGDGNIQTSITQDKNGKTTVKFSLNETDLKIGKGGADGKDGSIAVNGKDGSGVAINGKDGSITIDNGKNGANAKITVANGTAGLDGTNTTRIVYTDKDGKNKHEVATLDDGIKIQGNEDAKGSPTKGYVKLNQTLSIVGNSQTKNDWNDFDQGENIMTKVEGSKTTIALAKDLTGLQSAVFSNPKDKDKKYVTINENGVHLGDNGKGGIDINHEGIKLSGKKISDLADAENDKDAVNKGQLDKEIKKLTDNIKNGANFYFNAEADKGEAKVKNAEIIKFEGDENVKTSITQANGKTTVKFALNETDLKIGKKTANGSNGVDGKFTVSGKDGSSVEIEGKTGKITAKDKDGKNSVAINGKDGSIGLTKDGTNTTIALKKDGQPDVNGANGTNIPRLTYTTPNGNVTKTHEIATLDDGLKFAGNTGEANVKLNQKFQIKGSDSHTNAAWDRDFDQGRNIMTKIDGLKTTIALSKKLHDLTDAEFTSKSNGVNKTVKISGDKLEFRTQNGNSQSKPGVSIDHKGINMNNQKITNLADATEAKDAVNKGQLDKEIKDLTQKIQNGANFFFNAEADANTAQKVENGKNIKFAGDGNIQTSITQDKNGKTTVKFSLNETDLKIGKGGAGGVDGKITVAGKDNSVTIEGKDGSIGLNKDGTNTTITLKKDGKPDVNGADGTKMPRLTYTTQNGKDTKTHEIATFDDGLKFAGNTGNTNVKLNEKFQIKGGESHKDDEWDTKFDQGQNIMTKVENSKTTIALAKNLTGLQSATFGDPRSSTRYTKIDSEGLHLGSAGVNIGHDGINLANKKISDLADAEDEKDAVNKGQVERMIADRIANGSGNANANIKFKGDNGDTSAKNGTITLAGGQTDKSKLSDKPNIGVVSEDGKLNFKLAKDIDVNSVKANKITAGGVTIENGKISGVQSSLDPNLSDKLKNIDADTKKSDAEKAKEKKAAIQDALKNVNNGNVATVGDLKNVTNGLDSVVENVTNITNNITNITNMVANSDDKKKIDEASKAIEEYKKDQNDKNKQKAAEDAINANKIKTYNPYGTTVKNNTTIVDAIKNINERGVKFMHISDSDKVGENDDLSVNNNDSQANKKGSIGIGMNAVSDGTDAIATGTNSKASGANAIAMGKGAQATGENTISIGTGNKVTGKNSGAIGDPTTLENVEGVYSMGNNNVIQGSDNSANTAKDIFAIGNNIGSDTKKVTDKANGSVILGSKGYSSVQNGVALGYGSNADRDALTDKTSAYNGNDAGVQNTIKGTYGAVSVGDKDNTRQITNVAAGSADSDAVNVAQLKAATSKIIASTGGVSMSNVTIDPKTGKKVTITDANRANYAPKVTNDGVNSVAIGANSVANRPNTVSVGSAGNERIISNVADGVAPTDAANMRQLQSVANMVGEVKKDAMAGTASAMAIGNLPQATIPGKGMMAVGVGFYKGEQATALGVSKMSENGRWVFKASASYDSQRNVGAAGAIGFHF